MWAGAGVFGDEAEIFTVKRVGSGGVEIGDRVDVARLAAPKFVSGR